VDEPKPPIAVSACLLGERVRYDGDHKHEPLVTTELAATFRLVPVCPEVEAGLGVPRGPIHLVREGGEVRLRAIQDGRDLTGRLAEWSAERVEALRRQGIAGLVLKARSPSCGFGTAEVHEVGGDEVGRGSGVFAREVETTWPALPLIDEEALRDADARARFTAAVHAYHRAVSGGEGAGS
jgi:uncharacterized protein YbbK (DUF523 family)